MAAATPTSLSDHRLGARGRRALVTGTALVVAGVLPGFLTASLAPRIRGDFAFGPSTLGLAIAIFYVVCTLTSTPSGRLVERIGWSGGMRLTAAFTAASCFAVALFAHSAAGLIALASRDRRIGSDLEMKRSPSVPSAGVP